MLLVLEDAGPPNNPTVDLDSANCESLFNNSFLTFAS